jgi:hypothetical protein
MNKIKLTLLLFALCFLLGIALASASWGTIYYIDPNGNDTSGNGSSTFPWSTLSNACAKVTSPGDVIFINPGVYADNNRCNLAIGVTICGAGKSFVTIKSAYNGDYTSGYIFRVTTSANPVPHGHNDISGFTLDGSNKALNTGINISGTDYITIHDMKFQHIKTTAINLAGWDGWASYNAATVNPPATYGYNDSIHDVVIDDCSTQTTATFDDRLGAIELKSLANCMIYNVTINENYPNHGTGIKAVVGWLAGVKLYNTLITTDHGNTDSFGLEMYNFSGNSEIFNCSFNHYISVVGGILKLNSGWNLKIHDNTFNMTGLGGAGNELSHNWLNTYHNYFYGANSPAVGLWSSAYLTSTGVTHWRFNNNIVYNCSDGVFLYRGTNSYIEILNNTFDTLIKNTWGGYGIDGGSAGSMSGTKIQNNLIFNAVAGSIVTSNSMTGNVIDHNWLNAPNPGISGSGNRPSPYYIPNGTSSNLAGAGINVGLPFTGPAPAIGAYEPGAVPSMPTNLNINPD